MGEVYFKIDQAYFQSCEFNFIQKKFGVINSPYLYLMTNYFNKIFYHMLIIQTYKLI